MRCRGTDKERRATAALEARSERSSEDKERRAPVGLEARSERIGEGKERRARGVAAGSKQVPGSSRSATLLLRSLLLQQRQALDIVPNIDPQRRGGTQDNSEALLQKITAFAALAAAGAQWWRQRWQAWGCHSSALPTLDQPKCFFRLPLTDHGRTTVHQQS